MKKVVRLTIICRANRKRRIIKMRERLCNALIPLLQEEFPKLRFHKVYLKPQTPPENFISPNGRIGVPWWCPYCATLRIYKRRTRRYLRCAICRVSHREQSVRLINNVDYDILARKRSPRKRKRTDITEIGQLDPKKAARKARREARKKRARNA